MCLRRNLRHLIRVVMPVLQLRVRLCWQNTVNGKLGMQLMHFAVTAQNTINRTRLYLPENEQLLCFILYNSASHGWFHLPVNCNCTCMTFKSVLTLSSIKSNHCVFKKYERSGLRSPIPCTTPSLLWNKGGLKTIGLCFLGQWVWVPKNRLWIRAERRPRDPNALVKHT